MSKLTSHPVKGANTKLWRTGPDEYIYFGQIKTFAEFRDNKYFTYPDTLSKIQGLTKIKTLDNMPVPEETEVGETALVLTTSTVSVDT